MNDDLPDLDAIFKPKGHDGPHGLPLNPPDQHVPTTKHIDTPPDTPLGHLADAMLDLVKVAEHTMEQPIQVILFMGHENGSSGSQANGMIAHHGYEDGTDVLTDALLHIKHLAEAEGHTVLIGGVRRPE